MRVLLSLCAIFSFVAFACFPGEVFCAEGDDLDMNHAMAALRRMESYKNAKPKELAEPLRIRRTRESMRN